MHQVAVTGTAVLGILGILSGSTLLLVAGLAVVVVMLVTSGQLLDPARSRIRLIATHAATVLGLGVAAVVFRSSRIDAVLLVVLLGLMNRFVLRAGGRDDFIIAGAASVLMAATTTITPGLAFALLIAGFIPAVLWSLWSSTLLGVAEEVEPAVRQATLRRLGRQRVPRDRAFIAWSSLVFMVVGYVLLSLFPRYNFGRLLSAGYFMSLTGATTQMELTNGGVTDRAVDAVVLRVEPNPDHPPDHLDGLYARLYALDHFDGRTWSVGADPGSIPLYSRRDGYRGTPEVWERQDGATTVKVTLERLLPRTTRHPLAVLGRTRPGYVMARQPERALGGSVTAAMRMNAVRVVYKVDLARDVEPAPPPRFRLARAEAGLLEVPGEVDPRIRALAEELTRGLVAPGDKIRAVLGHFDAGFTYDLGPQEGTSDDPLVRFLFESKRGHCELYAGAVAVLLRLSGVKARVASGFYGGWWNESGGYLELGRQDAHAWVEAYDPAVGWRWVDATPETERSLRTPETFSFLGDLLDAVEAFWFDNVIDFDDRKRQALVGALSDRLGVGSDLFGALEGFGGEGGGGGGLGAGLLAVLGLGAAAGSLLLRRLVGRDRAESLGLRLRAALDAQAGPELPLPRLVERAPEACRAEARAAVGAYEALRFDRPERAPPLAEVRARVSALERALKAARRRPVSPPS